MNTVCLSRFVLSGSVCMYRFILDGAVCISRLVLGGSVDYGMHVPRKGVKQGNKDHHSLGEGLHGHGEAPRWWRRSSERAQASVWWEAKFNFSTEFPIAKHGSLWLVRDKGIRGHSLYVETCVNLQATG